MILVDTNVWIDHLRKGDPKLSALLQEGSVVTHPFVIGELACGTMRHRAKVLALLQSLPSARMATNDEVLFFIERHALMGRGLGFVDAHLLASVAIEPGTSMMTHDAKLHAVAAEQGRAFSP